MKVKRLKLRGYVIPTICVILVAAIIYSGYKIWELVETASEEFAPFEYVNTQDIERIKPTISVPETIVKPYVDNNVKVAIPFYNYNGSDEEQQNALIYYENIYMQNTGVMYINDNEFNVIAVMDGKVKNIKEDAIMGKIVEIEHGNNLITIYQSLNNVNVSINQELKQGEIIGLSGKNKIVDSDKYALHFEVYNNGELINPEEFYNMSIEDFNE